MKLVLKAMGLGSQAPDQGLSSLDMRRPSRSLGEGARVHFLGAS